MKSIFSRREGFWIVLLSFIALVLLPSLNAFLAPESVLHVSTFSLSLYGKYLCYAILAVAVNLLWGYTGLLSLGQCLFFSLGGYCLGMYLMMNISYLGQYHESIPDFMVFLEFPARFPKTGGLPPHWIPFENLWFALFMILVVPGLVAGLFGFLAFRSRIKGVYFSLLSQALTYAACLLFFRNDFTFGGNNGLTDFKFLLGRPALEQGELKDPASFITRLHAGAEPVSKHVWGLIPPPSQELLLKADRDSVEPLLRKELNKALASGILFDEQRFTGISLPPELKTLLAQNPKDAVLMQGNRRLLELAFPAFVTPKGFAGYVVNAPSTKRALYMCSAALLLLTYLFCRWLTSTKFGLIQRAVRDLENRVMFSGYATANFKLFVFVVAGIISAMGGALFVPLVGIINPGEMAPDKSLEAVVWCAVGGRGHMLGPILGAISCNALKSYATHALAEQWPYLLGSLFVFVTLFMPQGMIGVPDQIRALLKKPRTVPSSSGGESLSGKVTKTKGSEGAPIQ